MEVEHYASSVGLVVGHLGWCPKYRKKLFAHKEIKDRFIELLYEVEHRHKGKYGIRVDEVGVDEDHVHLVVRCNMSCSPTKLVWLFKGFTGRMLLREFPWIRKKYFWGCKGIWTKSHYYASTGTVDYKTVRNYVRRQGNIGDDPQQTKLTNFAS